MNQQQPQWTVNSQVETMVPDVTGRFITGVKVTFTTAAGDTASVFVPDREYTVDTVLTLIAQKVSMLNAIRSVPQ